MRSVDASAKTTPSGSSTGSPSSAFTEAHEARHGAAVPDAVITGECQRHHRPHNRLPSSIATTRDQICPPIRTPDVANVEVNAQSPATVEI